MSAIPSPLKTILALARGYLPRVVQARGWVLAALAMAPVALALVFHLLVVLSHRAENIPPTAALDLFHGVLVKLMLPIMAMVAAPAGIREDLEQRTLPLFLTRPAPVWAMPFGKGVLWFAWGGLWLFLAAVGLLFLGADLETMGYMALALVSAYWAQLAFMTLLGLLFKRGTLWGALYLFIWDPLVRILPNNLQRATFLHYIESITGSRGTDVSTVQLLAQQQISTPTWIAVIVLLALGLLFWGLSGWKLQSTPIGLAGADAEG